MPRVSSPDILIALDRAIADSGRTPDAVFSGHVHSYQRFTRRAGGHDLPFIVAGAGGYAHSPKAMHKLQTDANGKPLTVAPESDRAVVSGTGGLY